MKKEVYFEAECIDLTVDGKGIVKNEGRTYFVNHMLIGEVGKLLIIKEDDVEFNPLTEFRNTVDHLTAIRKCSQHIEKIKKIDSYFALYHFIMQCQIVDKAKESEPDIVEKCSYYTKLFEFRTYVKDLVKAYNTPFGYNLTRFKNLSIDALFDKNEVKEEKNELEFKNRNLHLKL